MSMEDIFAEALKRLDAGEPASAVVASYPPTVQAELKELLKLVEVAEYVSTQAVPMRAVQQRAARELFLGQAAALRSETQEMVDPQPAVEASPSLWDTLRERIRTQWENRPTVPALSLAPLAAVVIAVFVSTLLFVNTAKAALPGDPIFPLKQWVREQRIHRSAPETRPDAIRDAETQVEDELTVLAQQPSTQNSAVTELRETFVYYGRQGDMLRVGPLSVAPNFHPDPANFDPVNGVPEAMTLTGDFTPGVTVELIYQLLPGNATVVEGVSATVIDGEKPTPPPTPTPLETCPYPATGNWIDYSVQDSDTLATISIRTGVSIDDIQRANCLGNGTPVPFTSIRVPESFVVIVIPTTMPPEQMPTPIPAIAPAPTQGPPTPDFRSGELPVTGPSTNDPSGPPEPTIVGPSTGIVPETPAPIITFVYPFTGTIVPSLTGEPPLTAAPIGESTLSPNETPGVPASGTPTDWLPTLPTGNATGEPTGTITPEPGGVVTPEPTTTPAGTTTDSPTPLDGTASASTPAPVSTETAGIPTQAMTAVATPGVGGIMTPLPGSGVTPAPTTATNAPSTAVSTSPTSAPVPATSAPVQPPPAPDQPPPAPDQPVYPPDPPALNPGNGGGSTQPSGGSQPVDPNPSAPVYEPPAPVYEPPAPVYEPPAPVYVPPAPVYEPPAPVYVPPASNPEPPPADVPVSPPTAAP